MIIDYHFAKWAFGDDVWFRYLTDECDPVDVMDAWNNLHSDIFRIEHYSSLFEDMGRMRQAYEMHKHGEIIDWKMRKVTGIMKKAESEIKKGKPNAAAKTIKQAEKKNDKLADIDEKVRDPKIAKCDAVKKKHPKDFR